MQCYNAHGVVKPTNTRGGGGPIVEIDTEHLSMACKKRYNGRRNNNTEIYCNIFSVLPTIYEEECVELGCNGLNDQAQFESTFIPEGFRRGMGKFLGFLLQLLIEQLLVNSLIRLDAVKMNLYFYKAMKKN